MLQQEPKWLFFLKLNLLRLAIFVRSKFNLIPIQICYETHKIKFFCVGSFPRYFYLGASKEFDYRTLSPWMRVKMRYLFSEQAAMATCIDIFDLYKDDNE